MDGLNSRFIARLSTSGEFDLTFSDDGYHLFHSEPAETSWYQDIAVDQAG